jgi:hypothetical protein
MILQSSSRNLKDSPNHSSCFLPVFAVVGAPLDNGTTEARTPQATPLRRIRTGFVATSRPRPLCSSRCNPLQAATLQTCE